MLVVASKFDEMNVKVLTVEVFDTSISTSFFPLAHLVFAY